MSKFLTTLFGYFCLVVAMGAAACNSAGGAVVFTGIYLAVEIRNAVTSLKNHE